MEINNFKNIRFEIIDEEGRQYVKYGCDLKFYLQDDNKTLKIFVKNDMKKSNKMKKKIEKNLKLGLRLNCPPEKVIVPKNKKKDKHKKDYLNDE